MHAFETKKDHIQRYDGRGHNELHSDTTLFDRQLEPSVGAFPLPVTSPLLPLSSDELSLLGAGGGRGGPAVLAPPYPESGLLLEST